MKYWWRNIIKDYFTFSARERSGLVVMGGILTAIFLFSKFYPAKKTVGNKDAFQQELAESKISVDSSAPAKAHQHDENFADYAQPRRNDYASDFKGELFSFDPNTIDADGWKKLGVQDKTISTIQKFLASGYRFKRPEDIRKIYGLSKENSSRLVPYIHISADESPANNANATDRNTTAATTSFPAIRKPIVIDINKADTSEFIALPGIGSKLAARIVNFRQKLGGFSSVAQLGETYGIPDTTFQKIKPNLTCTTPALKTININTADINQLRTHPYLRWNIANAIINYRQQHGNFQSVEDLKKIDIITDDLYNKIAPYLVV